jgi:hypothetical protein
MDRARAEFMELQKMQFRAVTFMLAERILGKLRAKVTHYSVTRDFCDHTGGRNRQAKAVAIDNSGLGNWKWNNGQAIDQNMIRHHGERFDCNAHRPMRRAQDVDSVDLDVIDKADSPGDFGVTGKFAIDLLTQFWRKLLGVIQESVPEFFWKNDGTCNHRARQGTAASLVNSSNTSDASGAEFLLVTESATPIHAIRMLP